MDYRNSHGSRTHADGSATSLDKSRLAGPADLPYEEQEDPPPPDPPPTKPDYPGGGPGTDLPVPGGNGG